MHQEKLKAMAAEIGDQLVRGRWLEMTVRDTQEWAKHQAAGRGVIGEPDRMWVAALALRHALGER